MTETTPATDAPPRPLALFGIAVTVVILSAALGAAVNAVNGRVSPEYFVAVMRWEGIEDVPRASIAQGILEGLCFGVFFSLVFTVGVGVVTRASCSYGFAAAHLLGIVAGALVCWVVGGLAGMGLAALSPEFFRRAFVGVPKEFDPMLAFAWVGGSIWGLQLGGLLSVVLGLVVLWGDWRRLQTAPRPTQHAAASQESVVRSPSKTRDPDPRDSP